MTDDAGSDLVLDGGLTVARRREAVLDTARRYLARLAADDIPRLPARELRVRLGRCRLLLEALVEASRPGAPLARTVDEAAAALGVSPLTVYRLVNSGDLAAYRVTRRSIRIDEAALRSYLTGHAVGKGGVTSHDITERHIRPAWE